MGWVTLSLRKQALKQEQAHYQLRLLEISREKRQMARRKSFETNSILTQQRQAERALKNNVYEQAKKDKKDHLEILENAWKQYRLDKKEGIVDLDKLAKNKGTRQSEYDDYNVWKKASANGSTTDDYQTWHSNTGRVDDNGNPYSLVGRSVLSVEETNEYELEIDNNALSLYSTDTNMIAYNDWENNTSLNTTGFTKESIQEAFEEASLAYQEAKNDLKTDYEFELQQEEEEAADEELILDQEQTEIEAQLEAISQEIESVGSAASSAIQSSTIKLA